MAGFFGYGQGASPQGRYPSRPGSINSIVDGLMGSIRAPAMRASREAAIGEGIRRFEAIGTEEAMGIAKLMGENPRGAAMYADTFGGFEKLFGQYKNNALQQRASKATAGLSSYDEYMQSPEAQALPLDQRMEFAQAFAGLEKTRSETLENLRPPEEEGAWKNIRNPDTGVMEHRWISRDEIAAATGQIGQTPDPGLALRKKSADELQNRILVNKDSMERLSTIKEDYQKEFLQIPTQAWVKVLDFAERLSVDLSPDQQKLVDEFNTFETDVLENLNIYIHDMTGAQMSEFEAKRLTKALPVMKMGETKFKSKLEAVYKRLALADRRYRFMLNAGMIEAGHDFDTKVSPLREKQFKKIENERLDELFDEIEAEQKASGIPQPDPRKIGDLAWVQYQSELGGGWGGE